MWRPSSRLGDTLQKRWGGGVSYPQLPQAAAALTHTLTHTHTHTYSLRALGTSTGESRIHRRRRGRRQQRRQWEESWWVQLDKPRYKARNGMMHSASASLRPVRDHMRVAVCRV